MPYHPPPAGRDLSVSEWFYLAAGMAIAHGFFIHIWLYPSAYDAAEYLQAAADIATNGLFSKYIHSEIRTYGYPLFLAGVLEFTRLTRLPFGLALFEIQLALYTQAVFFLRRTLFMYDAVAARIGFCGLMLNFYVLLYASDSLTESLSLSLLVLAAACLLRLLQDRRLLWALAGGSLAVGVAVMIRPANIFMAAAWIVSCGIALARARLGLAPLLLRAAAMILALALPMAPQLINNIRHHDASTPLVAQDLGAIQQRAGVMYLKYASGMPPLRGASIEYRNPYLPGTILDVNAPLHWYVDHPREGLMSAALHVFNLTDQDLLFTYARDLDPWYRIPLSVLNHGIVAIGLLGLAMFIWSARNMVERREPAAALVLLLGAHIGVYATAAVEMRFGLPLLLVLFPFSGYAVWRVVKMSVPRRTAVVVYGMCYVAMALGLSSWVRTQAPMIVAAANAAPAQ